MNLKIKEVRKFGNTLVSLFHFIALFVIGATVVWSFGYEYIQIFNKGYAELKDILLLFIYLEIIAMIGVYFKTHRLPVQFLIFIAITALSRHLVVDVQQITSNFHLFLLLSITFSIVLLSASLWVLAFVGNKFGRPEDNLVKNKKKKLIKN